MIRFLYKTKKELKAAVGQPLRYRETSMFGPEYLRSGTMTGVIGLNEERQAFANVTMEDDVIKEVK